MQDDIILSVLKAIADDDLVAPAEPEPEDDELEATPARATRWTMPGFCAKARVTTSFGDLPVEALRLRDPVKTQSGEYRPVAWVDRMHLDEGFLSGFRGAAPIRFQQNALGRNYPNQNVMLSPGQRVVVPQEWSEEEIFTADELSVRTNIERLLSTQVTYYMFHVGAPDVVLVDGMWCPVSP